MFMLLALIPLTTEPKATTSEIKDKTKETNLKYHDLSATPKWNKKKSTVPHNTVEYTRNDKSFFQSSPNLNINFPSLPST